MSSPAERNWSNLALLRLNAFGVGINGFYFAIDTVVLPVLVLVLAPEALKNTFLAGLGLSGLLVAGLVQVVAGTGGKSLFDGSFAGYPFVARGYSATTSPRAEYGFALIAVSPSRLVVQYVGAESGRVIDEFSISAAEVGR